MELEWHACRLPQRSIGRHSDLCTNAVLDPNAISSAANGNAQVFRKLRKQIGQIRDELNRIADGGGMQCDELMLQTPSRLKGRMDRLLDDLDKRSNSSSAAL